MPLGANKLGAMTQAVYAPGYFEYIVIGGGGGGGGGSRGGGGGAGAFETHLTNSAGIQYLQSGTTYTIKVGEAGTTGTNQDNDNASSGDWSGIQGPDIFPIVACGGGHGGAVNSLNGAPGKHTEHPTLRGIKNISSITRADPCVVTFTSAHGLTSYTVGGNKYSNYIHFAGVGGMTELNWGGTGVQSGVGPIFSYEVVDSTSIKLYDAYPHTTGNQYDSSGNTAYTSGGTMHPWGFWDGGSAGGDSCGADPGSASTVTRAANEAHAYSTTTNTFPMNLPGYASVPGNYATNGNNSGATSITKSGGGDISGFAGGGGGSAEAGNTDGDGQGGDGTSSDWEPGSAKTYASGGGGTTTAGSITGSGSGNAEMGNGGHGNGHYSSGGDGPGPRDGAVILKIRTSEYTGTVTPSDSTAPTTQTEGMWTYVTFRASGTYTH